MTNKARRKYLAYGIGAAIVAPLSFYHFSFSEESDDELFIMHDLAREYWLKGGVGYCGSEMRPNFNVVKEAAMNGNALAALRLGQVYASGFWGVEQNDAESFKWYLMAAEGGVNAAQIKVGLAYELGIGVDDDQAEAIKWFERAILSGKHPDLEKKIEEYRKNNP